MNVLFTYFIAGFLGVLFHMFAIKIPSVKNKAKDANHPFSLKAYLQDDYPALLGNLICVVMLIVGIKEVLNLKPALAEYITWLFFFVGVTGSSLFMHYFSKFDKKVRMVIDVKTNAHDGVKPPVNEHNKQGLEAIKEEGVAIENKSES